MKSKSRVPGRVRRQRGGERIAPLASLPLFFSLEGRRVVVAGGTDAAAWKAELLAAAGAAVHVFAIDPCQEMRELVEAGSPSGSFDLHRRGWTGQDLQGAALAICDAANDEEASCFHEAARVAGVPVNIIDNPAYCAFKFGSIVNRSPVVVGISTNGAAPILGQAIRRRVETLLPQSLTGWAALAASLRDRVSQSLAAGLERRRFWEGFAERALSGAQAPKSNAVDVGRGNVRSGHVTLVGAGPGDAEYLTLKAVRALQGADVILFDDLVDDAVLELARREAKRMLVGKRGGRESCRQEDINDMMVRLAHQGKNVVRLKSGDPTIFGRAGEELQRLADEGIPATVVPGITAASAMAARLGLSLTHRDHAQTVRFVTGHARHGGLPDTVDWKGLTEPAATTVFYMGGRMAGRIGERLMAEGAAPSLPVVVMAAISRTSERRWQGALSELGRAMEAIALDDPVLIGVGQVFAGLGGAAARSDLQNEALGGFQAQVGGW